jgi:spore germination cell wall hydrolase CwlJ-like protein
VGVVAISEWVRMLRLSKLGMLGIACAICAAVPAYAALRAIVAKDNRVAVADAGPTGYDAQDHFPGAAELYAMDDINTPQEAGVSGATGTIELPDMPLPSDAATAVNDGTIHPAQPFSMRAASTMDRSRALQCLTAAVYYEAAREPDAGQQAVAQVILNRVRHPAFPATVCGVVYQGSEHAGCQFSFACDGSTDRGPDRAYWARAAAVAAQALGGRVFAPVGLATHYHTYAVTPAWNRSLVMTAAIGAHFFHRWQGWWGTPAAFRQGYVGHEPFPGPHARPEAPPVALAANAPMPVAPQRETVTPVAAIQPRYADSGKPLVTPVGSAARVPAKQSAKAESAVVPPGYQGDDSQILDKWKDSGKPLR